jgi:glycerol-3-phosphate responsive antiterminator
MMPQPANTLILFYLLDINISVIKKYTATRKPNKQCKYIHFDFSEIMKESNVASLFFRENLQGFDHLQPSTNIQSRFDRFAVILHFSRLR